MTRINQTLLTKLFTNPAPQPKRKEVLTYFNRLQSRMFPGADDFIEFLSAQNVDRQYESAERIVQRLCYYSNFPPSYYAMMDVVCVEHFQKNGVSVLDDHIPRDHFLHIVFLYMLGIYVFFYDTEFYSKIVYSNKFERDSISLGNIEFSCIKDFISEWKYFCLFHDVGYTAEILGNKSIAAEKENSLNEKELEKYLKVLRKNNQEELKKSAGGYKASFAKDETLKQIAYLGTLEIMAKLFFANLVICNSEETVSPKHKIFKRFQKQKLFYQSDTFAPMPIKFNKLPSSCITGNLLDRRVCSNQCLKQLAPIFDIDKITVIGIQKETGQVGFVFFAGENNQREFVYTESAQTDDELKSLFTSPRLVLFDDFIPEHYELRYLITGDKGKFNEHLELLEIGPYFSSVIDVVNKEFGSGYNRIRTEEQFLDFSFTLYYWLFKQIENNYYGTQLEEYLNSKKSSSDDDSKEKRLNKENTVYDSISSQILYSLSKYKDEIRDICSSLLSNKIIKELNKNDKENGNKKTSNDNDLSLAQMIEQQSDSYFSLASKFVNDENSIIDFKEQLDDAISDKIQKEIDLMAVFSHIYGKLKNTLNKSKSWFTYDYIKSSPPAKPPFLKKCINDKLNTNMHMKMNDVMDEYELKHGITVDHGIASAFYAASVFYCYRCAIEKAKTPQEQLLLSILLDIPGKIEDSKVAYIADYDHVFTSVLYAIYTHNLYPSHFSANSKGREYKTKMTDPFSYLALLCDSLQDWNRPKNLHPAWIERVPIRKASEGFNIEVSESGIVLSDNASKSTKWIDKTINSLSDYLYNIDAYLRKG